MVHAQSASPRHPIFTALFGMMVLTLGMGVGRFLYTPMLPVMLAEKQLTFNQLSWIASANYAGYLAGSLLFSFGLFHLPSRLRPMLLASAVATGILILAMAIFTQPAVVSYLFAADGEKRGLSATHGAPLVVGRPGDHSRLLRLAVGGKTLGRPAMPDREPVDPERLRAAVSRQRLVVAVNTEQYWFWRHVYGHNLAGDAACPTTQRAG